MSDPRLTRNLEQALGQTVMTALSDPMTLEIMANPCGSLWVERFGEPMREVDRIAPEQARRVVSLVASALGTTITREQPVVEGELPLDGSRFEGTDYPIVPGPSFTIRKKPSTIFTLESYAEAGILEPHLLACLQEAILRKCNILVAGGTGSGKTTFVNAMIDSLCRLCPHDRIICMEDTNELQVASPNRVLFRTSETMDMQRLTKICMRYRPDRIIVGEVRDGAALDLLKAWNTGHPGGLATLHADSAVDALGRLEDLIAERLTSPMHRLISRAINVVIFIQKTSKGRRITEVTYVYDYDWQRREYNLEYILENKARANDEHWFKQYIAQ
ncbi:P-type conjugative transfer ATPase TrbB [Solidesulfovibrio carbinoliphilus subsp. oakridgensis]|uniref:P-type conjugative transfer ATPase TrbB n=1 Tax=Solidesulfovibrio carbinoliphilus subsp. oakridgensis TaxID=694327 RepID=G7QB60_9BACT|nr:P-type conjugative transfer ATPase TrbB [Solidesulfovibrio carbinoliphilus]EHJ48802.1 P-type conjugative transfer ATPase TrbB [Solidesulfovibrio carbinoliphilus subsp. oakridgensis]